MELSLLCDSGVLLVVASEDEKSISLYCSKGNNKSDAKNFFKNIISKNFKHNWTNTDVGFIFTNNSINILVKIKIAQTMNLMMRVLIFQT